MPEYSSSYSFDSYINWRLNVDYYDDDAFLKSNLKVFAGADWGRADKKAREISQKVSTGWRQLSEISARNNYQPQLQHFDAFNQRVDRIARCAESRQLEEEIFSLALFSPQTSAWEKFIQLFLIYENGEACISCPLACTEGLAELLDEYADTPELIKIRDHLREGINGRYAIGAQFMTEIQGGSDISANRVEAEENGNNWRIYGKKFFCSVAHADYFLITAKPAGQEKIAASVVPAKQPDDCESETRNFYRIERLKPKLGTRELPTAEISFNGASAYLVGSIDKGISHVVSVVLGCSRLTIGIFSAAIMSRAVREAHYYAGFREAFGRPIAEFAMLAGQLAEMQMLARQTTAGIFGIFRQIQLLAAAPVEAENELQAASLRRQRFEIRELIMLQKIVAAADSVDVLRGAISVFGGNGVIEDFSSLPRLLSDAMVNELWEGPRNVLLAQIYRDFQQGLSWYPVDQFVNNLLAGSGSLRRKQLAREMLQMVAAPPDDEVNDDTIEFWANWERCCIDLMHGYQRVCCAEVE
ncbi:MAG: acyl-CoA dehydrogenase [Gammaproteobacteria bacterium]|nr:acyl-CoA dehydrogenase [Gammaproteobacteria bacterium]